MAAKKKQNKSRQKQRQKKQQRRASRLQKRQQRSGPSRPEFGKPSQALLEDAQPILEKLRPSLNSLNIDAEDLWMDVMDSEDLLYEPEIENIMIDPMEAVGTYIRTAEEMGLAPDQLDALPSDVRDEKVQTIFERTTRHLLTKKFRQELMAALTNLRRRLKAEGEEDEVPRVATVQLFLEIDREGNLAANLGLVEAIVRRSVEAGFAMGGLITDIEKLEDSGDLTFAEMQERVLASGMAKPLKTLIEQSPGFQHFIDQKIDTLREEGDKALFSGQLQLGVFTDEEVAEAAALADKIIESNLLDVEDEPFKASMEELVPQLLNYITEIFAPPRLDQLRQRMNELLKDSSDIDKRWLPYISMFNMDISEENGLEYGQRTLLLALFGEIWPALLEQHAEIGELEDG